MTTPATLINGIKWMVLITERESLKRSGAQGVLRRRNWIYPGALGQGRRRAGRRLGSGKWARFPESGGGGRPRQARLIDDRPRACFGGPAPERFVMNFWIRAIRGASARVDGPWQRPDLTLPPKRPVWSQASEVAVGRSRRLGDFFISPLLDRKVDFVVWPHQARTVRFRGYPSCQEDWARPPLLRTADGRCAPPMEDAERR